jgi:hypothetical protein
VLEEAGPSGLSANDVFQEVLGYIPDAQRPNVLTHLSRLKTGGDIVVEGSTREFTYFAKTHQNEKAKN